MWFDKNKERFLQVIFYRDSLSMRINNSIPCFCLILYEKTIFWLKIFFQGCKMQKYFIKYLHFEKNSINLPDFLVRIVVKVCERYNTFIHLIKHIIVSVLNFTIRTWFTLCLWVAVRRLSANDEWNGGKWIVCDKRY